MIKFGTNESLAIPLVLPGVLLTLGSAAILHLHRPHRLEWIATAFESWLRGTTSSSPTHGATIAAFLAVGVLAIYLLSIFSGVVLAIVAGYVEIVTLDKLEERRRGDDYWNQWYRYVAHLEEQKSENPFISGMADLFLFQFRCAIACILLGLLSGVLAYNMAIGNGLLLTCSIGFLGAAALLCVSAAKYHMELADIRQRRFGESGRVLGDAFEMTSSLISRWCARQALDPLRLALPIWPLKTTKPELLVAVGTFEKVLELPQTSVLQSERDQLKCAKRLLEAEAAKLAQ